MHVTSRYKLALLKIAPADWEACTAVCIEVVQIKNELKHYNITKYTKAMWRKLSQMKNSGKPGNTRYWGNPPFGLGDDKCFFRCSSISWFEVVSQPVSYFFYSERIYGSFRLFHKKKSFSSYYKNIQYTTIKHCNKLGRPPYVILYNVIYGQPLRVNQLFSCTCFYLQKLLLYV